VPVGCSAVGKSVASAGVGATASRHDADHDQLAAMSAPRSARVDVSLFARHDGHRATVLTRALVAGLLAGYGVAVPIGAIAPLLITLTARTSLRVGVAAALGVATVDGCYALVAVLFGSFLAPWLNRIATPLHWTAAAVLVFVAVRVALTSLRPAQELPPVAGRRAYLTMLGLTALNPTTIVYFGALVLGSRAGGAVFVPAVFAASASWQLLLACGGRLLGRHVATPRGRVLSALVGSAVISVLAVRLVL
jgi:arginine exporter protein ArgO